MHQVDHFRWRPNGVLKVVGIGYHQLFYINNIGDEKQVDAKKYDQCNVHRAFG